MTILNEPQIHPSETDVPIQPLDPGEVAALAASLRQTAAEHDRTGQLSADVFDRLRDVGLTRALVPTEFGGGGATHEELGAMLRTIGAADPAVAVTLSMHSHLVAFQAWRHHHGQDARPMFEKVVNGAILVSTGASDWVSSSGSARRVGDGYRVTARKAPSSGAEFGDVMVTSIRWDDGPDGPQVLHCAIPFAAEGVSIERTWDTLGMRATGSHTIVLDDVFVPDAAVSLVRPADVWHPVWNIVMGAAMPTIMAAYLGIADAAVDLAIASASDRPAPHLPSLVGEMLNAHTTASDAVAAMLASSDDLRFDNTDAHAAVTLSRKTVAAAALVETVRLAVEVVGGSAYSRTSTLERLWRDVQGAMFHPLPRSQQLAFTGNVALGRTPRRRVTPFASSHRFCGVDWLLGQPFHATEPVRAGVGGSRDDLPPLRLRDLERRPPLRRPGRGRRGDR